MPNSTIRTALYTHYLFLLSTTTFLLPEFQNREELHVTLSKKEIIKITSYKTGYTQCYYPMSYRKAHQIIAQHCYNKHHAMNVLTGHAKVGKSATFIYRKRNNSFT